MVDITNDSKILEIDLKIRTMLQDEIESLTEYKKKQEELKSLLEIPGLSSQSIEKINHMLSGMVEKISNATSRQRLEFYILESSEIVNKYKVILQTPISVSFTGKSDDNRNSETIFQKNQLVAEYLKIAQKYLDIFEFYASFNATSSSSTKVSCLGAAKKSGYKLSCSNCKKKVFDVQDNTTHICVECGTQHDVPTATISFKDIDRVNISTKFTYERLIHFRDCIKQYQGKQNTCIDKDVYDDLEKQFELHHLLIGDKNTPRKERFKNITKEHISIFLKDLRYTRHYENINLIHYNLTEVPPDDISHLENKLMDDFIILTELYNKYKQEKRIPRKSFINSQYVLYQLLNRHKHQCKKEDFNILKTIDRQYFHDEVTKDLFQELCWNMVFLF